MMEPSDQSSRVKNLGKYHLNSFNFTVSSGITSIYNDIDPVFLDENLKISVSEVKLEKLQYPMDTRSHKRVVYPSEARLRGSTYLAELHVELCFEKDYGTEDCETFHWERIFFVPAMVKSGVCYLNGLDDYNLMKVKEDVNDPGGYFIINGNERLIRTFVVSRRNYPLALRKTAWKTYGQNYSDYGILIRSVKEEHSFSNVSIHYLTYGAYEARIFLKSYANHINLMLLMKALVDKSDKLIINEVLKFHKHFPVDHLKTMMLDLQASGISSHFEAKRYIGELFSAAVHLSPAATTGDIADYVLKKSFLIHLNSFENKFQFLCYSLCKLHCAVNEQCRLDDQDNPVYQEVLVPGQTYMIALKFGILTYLKSVKSVVEKKMKNNKFKFLPGTIKQCCNRAISLSQQVTNFIATGNMPKRCGHGLPSMTGYTVPLKRTNVFELIAQFTAICKFSVVYYAKNQRKFYPESWGFLCPTQTPEGENCGLYNYLASQCKVVELSEKKLQLELMGKLGVLPLDDPTIRLHRNKYFVIVDGLVYGWIKRARTSGFVDILKTFRSSNMIPDHCEVVCLRRSEKIFPGIFLFSSPCRLVRKILKNSKEEFLGCYEQTARGFDFDEIEQNPDVSVYAEINETNFLSPSAAMIPFCENNPAVRNIFSSVKSKQAIALPYFNVNGRADSKTSQLVYSQSPSVVTKMYHDEGFDLFPHGANVIVAVISYSGFDMEDAVTLNKSSIQRGLLHHVTYKTDFYGFDDLAAECNGTVTDIEFKRNDKDLGIAYFVDSHGFPYVGQKVHYNDPILSLYCKKTERWLIKRYLYREDAQIHSVKLTGDVPASKTNIPKNSKKVSITFVTRKVPEVGDKFSNRHGGKGICSYLMDSEDLPFSENGMVPDILFNPHGLPSRMSTGMLFEMAAGKAAVTSGSKFIVEQFEDKKAHATIGKALVEAGLDYYGSEKFYSGLSGNELEADIFCGSMYYLRFHHIVEEKYQVRALGPRDEKTYQPINPARSGAIRVGEMEKDAIMSHGAMSTLMDRMLHNSDKCTAYICLQCHTIIYPILQNPEDVNNNYKMERNSLCNLCIKHSSFKVQIPFVLVYLVTELSVLGIKVKFSNV